ncbi:GDP-mannose 4,6-dehydratase [Solibacillus sp. MA9]|uniref:GDP-mannose 4,6-dehydratase n=1 Tax=Solibacillus palustris TaxID=2908203 RepID=A0ABS9UA93_9BACL|nr:NAD-dependent epimerase/dehydratase family protein [Solibacillus sp. MA9]MCH7321060.1 GDP-mannose 4,6-dehydratase [Solibacillus sp. MA9]
MKVLITGGYGFIGSHVAEQFYKEGYEVHILDNLSTGKQDNVSIKHKKHITSITDPKCKEIFASYQFDFVIHLAAQVSVANSIQNPIYDAEANILGLINMLQLAQQYNVKKFVFASSAAIYGNNTNLPLNETEIPQPIAPYGLSKWVGEQYCSNWETQHKIDVINFRFSNVYGPRQTSEGEGGVVATFIAKAHQNETLEIHGDGSQTRDFIYVKDVAYAIFRATQSFITGTYNLSTNTQTSVFQLVEILKAQGMSLTTTYTNAREGDILHSSLNNTKVKTTLDWVPMYTIDEGLANTYLWAQEQQQKRKKKETRQAKKKYKFPNWLIQSKSYLENTLIFILISFLLLQLNLPSMSIFIFGVFYIMAIGSIYGNQQSFTSVVLSFLLLVYDYLHRGREAISLLYDSTFLFQIVTFLFIGLLVGYSVQRKNDKISEQYEQLQELQVRYQFLEDVHTEVREVNEELQFRVKNNEDSFGKIYSLIKELDNLEPEKIFTNTVMVVERVMNSKDVSIYVLNKNHTYLRLTAHSEFTRNEQLQTSLKVDETPYIQQIIATGQPFINRALEPNVPLMVAPIFYDQEIRAIISIGKLPFENFSQYYENLFIVVKQLIQSSLSRAFEFIKLSEDNRYIESTNILQMNTFKEILAAKKEAKDLYGIPYHLLTFTVEEANLIDISKTLGNMLRETDYLGYNHSKLHVLLSNTNEVDLPFILKRFYNAGFEHAVDEKVYNL